MQELPEAYISTAVVRKVNEQLCHTSSFHSLHSSVNIGLKTDVVIGLEGSNEYLKQCT
jgi:hypothetical protein